MAAAAPRAYGPFEGCGRGQPPLGEWGAGPPAVGWNVDVTLLNSYV